MRPFLFHFSYDIMGLMNKYLIQILVILVFLAAAWVLFLLGGENKIENPEQASVLPARLPISEEFFPVRNWSFEDPEIDAQSGIVMDFKQEQGTVLFKKNIKDILPIASLTKIMTAIIVLENFDLEQTIRVSKNSISTLGDKGGLIRGEELKVKDLLSIMLIESSNDAAMALANDSDILSYNEFLELMNIKARTLNLENTHFLDPIGLNSKNKSTVYDLAYLTNYALNYPVLWEILKTHETTVYSIDNKFVHNLINTNELLDKISILKGGKTGYTQEANGCMLTVSEINSSFGDNYLITVVLGSNQREADTETLIVWAKKAYIW